MIGSRVAGKRYPVSRYTFRANNAPRSWIRVDSREWRHTHLTDPVRLDHVFEHEGRGEEVLCHLRHGNNFCLVFSAHLLHTRFSPFTFAPRIFLHCSPVCEPNNVKHRDVSATLKLLHVVFFAPFWNDAAATAMSWIHEAGAVTTSSKAATLCPRFLDSLSLSTHLNNRSESNHHPSLGNFPGSSAELVKKSDY